ncbi:hypothetical protein K435DRAFT_434055 [Dendrothele bispora CBS 962.96]|uniref:Uncharacterized protein n=1 Tax=Dendrothele bispora (strain CBS 962.96) TaxID=1314807 RepID=A0A4V4HCF0_DENBC|nr:hypothetical protein K435DRAFT_434055 [Dendrothele bispora CBS 962.96]
MSVAQPLLPPTTSLPITTRKRTNSFSYSSASSTSPRPSKSQRTAMGSLRRTESYICLTDLQSLPSSSSSLSGSSMALAYDSYSTPSTHNARSMRQCKEKRERRKAYFYYPEGTFNSPYSSPYSDSDSELEPSSYPSTPLPPTPKSPPKQQCPAALSAYRISSPLSPVRTVLPARPTFPRSKHEPDLYKQAITTRMRCTPEGQQILNMGPRLALSIMTATRDLELIVAAQSATPEMWDGSPSSSADVVMSDAVGASSNATAATATSSSSIVHNEDWEMVDCISS